MISYIYHLIVYIFTCVQNFFKNSSIKKAIADYLNDVIDTLEKIPSDNFDKESSIHYLKRDDVLDQLTNIIVRNKIIHLDSKIKRILGIIYLDMIGTTEDNTKYELNFWPCAHCSCIGVQQIK